MPNKFTKQDTRLLTGIKRAIKNETKKRDFELDYEVFDTKHLTECPRRLYYRVNASHWDAVKKDQDLNNNYDIKYSQDKWMDLFVNLKNIYVINRKLIAADSNYNVAGIIDGVLKYEDIFFVVLIDRLDSEKYADAKKDGGSRRQIVELIANLWLTEINNGILVCEDKSTNDYFLSHTIAYAPIIEGIKTKCLDLIEKKIAQQLPVRPYEHKNNKECNICEYRKFCWTT